MQFNNAIIERLKQVKSFEHQGTEYPIGRSTPFGICQKYYDLIVGRGMKRVLEIGTLYGQSTLYLGEAVKVTGGHVRTVDLRPERRIWMNNVPVINLHEVAERFVEESGLTQYVEFLVGDSTAILPRLIERGDEYDFVLIDGGHEYYIAVLDFINADRLLCSGGIIALDDIGAGISRVPEFHGGPNRMLPMIFASGRYAMTSIGTNVMLCERK